MRTARDSQIYSEIRCVETACAHPHGGPKGYFAVLERWSVIVECEGESWNVVTEPLPADEARAQARAIAFAAVRGIVRFHRIRGLPG